MMDFEAEKKRFSEGCTACGECVSVCPIIAHTEIAGVDPQTVMAKVLAVFRQGVADDVARLRIYSCMSCLTCQSHCPEGLDPGLGLSLAREILHNAGEAMPRGLAFLLPESDFNLMKAIEAVQIEPRERIWVTDVETRKPPRADTVLFTGCTGIMQPDLILAARDLIRRIDPTVQILGGVDFCCGDTNLRAGRPRAAEAHFLKLVSGLDAFQPSRVLFMCPTCKAFFDLHRPNTDWSWQFVTRFLADHIEQLGPLNPIQATVTLHDACHLVRGEDPDLSSPREILAAIPGVQVKEMRTSGTAALCCGGSAMAAVGKPGAAFRARRLAQARETGADIMLQYCPGCQSVFAPEQPKLPFAIESLVVLLGRSAGIVHEDRLQYYLNLRDGSRVLQEVDDRIAAADVPADRLRNFIPKYFR